MQVRILMADKVVKATSTNVSESGIALMLREALPKGAEPRLQFVLPETSFKLDLEAEVVWADVKGRAGLRFRNVPQDSQQQMEKWLDDRIEEELPGAKERIAATDKNQQ